MSRKTVYYHDPLHDDFAPTNGRIHPKQIGADFPYEHKGPLWNALAFVVYRMVMTPFLFLYCKLVFGLRIENRKALRALPGGYFLYGNHTNTLADAFIPTLLSFPRRANIITSADTVSIPGVRNIVQMLGAIPLANTIEGTRQFLAAMHRRLERFHGVPKGCPVCISGRRMGRQHDLGVDKLFLLVVEFCFLVVLAEQPFAALISGPGNSGLPLAALDDGDFEMRTRNRHHPQTKRPPSKIALDERSNIKLYYSGIFNLSSCDSSSSDGKLS